MGRIASSRCFSLLLSEISLVAVVRSSVSPQFGVIIAHVAAITRVTSRVWMQGWFERPACSVDSGPQTAQSSGGCTRC